MALECLAILGGKNEPLYLCATGKNAEDEGAESDAFGFLGDDSLDEKRSLSSTLSVRQEVRPQERKLCMSGK